MCPRLPSKGHVFGRLVQAAPVEMGAEERLLYDQLEAEGLADSDNTNEDSDEDYDGDSGSDDELGDKPAAEPMQLLLRLHRLRRAPIPHGTS